MDAFTKAFLELLWSMRHVTNLNEGKLEMILVTGLTLPRSKHVSDNIAKRMQMENMYVVGAISFRGNLPCLTCGHGSECKMSGNPLIFGKGVKASSDLCVRIEDQKKVQRQISRIGELLNERLST